VQRQLLRSRLTVACSQNYYEKTIQLLQQAVAIDHDLDSRAVTEKKLAQYVERKVVLKREILKSGGTLPTSTRALPAIQQQQVSPSPSLIKREASALRSFVLIVGNN
jgi:hypothetical protein